MICRPTHFLELAALDAGPEQEADRENHFD